MNTHDAHIQSLTDAADRYKCVICNAGIEDDCDGAMHGKETVKRSITLPNKAGVATTDRQETADWYRDRGCAVVDIEVLSKGKTE